MTLAHVTFQNWVGIGGLGFVVGVAFAAWRQTVIEREDEIEPEEVEHGR